MSTVSRGELTSHKMAAGNEAKYSKVVLNGILKEWVGIGWIDHDPPVFEDIHDLQDESLLGILLVNIYKHLNYQLFLYGMLDNWLCLS